MRRWWTRRSRRTSTSGMWGDERKADAACGTCVCVCGCPSVSRAFISRVSASDVLPGRFVVCLLLSLGPPTWGGQGDPRR
eukprot:6648790-Prymnesium_polylepis.1